MIRSVIILNTSGVPRLTKFYSPIRQSAQAIVAKIYSLISTRSPGSCNFLEAPELDELLGREDDNEKLRVVYRSYATLHFIFVVDTSESELGILDLIQVRDLTKLGVFYFVRDVG
jgi:AP-3 complex subunit sigma